MKAKQVNRRQEILKAIKRAKDSNFKATAIKIELEAQLDREGDWESERNCHDFLMKQLVNAGVARKFKRGEHDAWIDEVYDRRYWHGEYKPEGPLVFSKVYNDGSVDTEWTFTILLDKPENIFLVGKALKAWNKMIEGMGATADVGGAGLHMAFLQDEEGVYPIDSRGINGDDATMFKNFKKSMRPILPALFFLGARNDETRGMKYRKPKITMAEIHGDKYAAIHYTHGALEFRLFDTCYETPDRIFDNIVVMSKTLRFWSKKFIPNKPIRIAKGIVKFGTDGSNKLERLYGNMTHVELLNAGLRLLKPAYKTIREMKRERGFNVSRKSLMKREKEIMALAEKEYEEYENRHALENRIQEQKEVYFELSRLLNDMNYSERAYERALTDARRIAASGHRRRNNRKKTKPNFVKESLEKKMVDKVGQWHIGAAT